MAKKTLKDKLKKRLEEQKLKKQSGDIYFLKADSTVRIRILAMGEEQEFIQEIKQFYLGQDIKGVISPDTFGEPCAINEAYEELKNSSDDDEKELATKFAPRARYLALCVIYKDDKGKELDERFSPKFVMLTSGVYQEILELYLDESEWGDMTDIEDGYDIKIKRTGSGKMDTEYTVSPCKPTPTPKAFSKPYDLDEEIRKIMPTYEKTKEILNQYLGFDPDDDEEKPRKKKKVIKKKKSDLDD